MEPDHQLIARFIEMMSAQRGAAANSLLAYQSDLQRASELLKGGLGSAGTEQLRMLIADYAQLAPSSHARKLSALRGFYRFLVDDGWREDDPSASIARPQTQRSLPKIVSRADAEAMFAFAEERLAQATAQAQACALRDLVLLELLYGSGLRASELVSLPRRAIAPGRPFIIIRGKGGKERMVPLSDRARAVALRWMDTLPPENPWLFPSRARHLSRIRLYQLVKDVAAGAGIPPERVSPHVWRHAFATHLLEGGADLRTLQAMLGHSAIATTEVYTHLDARRLSRLVQEKHPLAQMGEQQRTRHRNVDDGAAAP